MKTNRFITAILFFSFLILPSCQKVLQDVCEREGRIRRPQGGIFVGKWFDYYDRALTSIEGECYDIAISDLDEAIRGRAEDERMVRTYGMHFIDYFPHREKGIIYFLHEDFDRAKIELEHSMQTEPSAKAAYYLNMTRRGILQKEKQELSTPAVIPDFPESEIWTNADPVIISGTAHDPQYIAEILIQGHSFEARQAFMEISGQTAAFHERLHLEQGRHEISLTARNLLGGVTDHRIVIHADRKGPVIAVIDVQPGFAVTGAAYDESGDISVSAGGSPVQIRKADGWFFFEIPLSGVEALTIEATDKAGNRTAAVLDSFDLMGRLSASLAADAENYAGSSAPQILLTGLQSGQTVFSESVVIEGQVKSSRPIRKLTVNDHDAVGYPGRLVFFSHTVGLREGVNLLTAAAEDDAGNRTVRKLLIERRIPEPFQHKNRYCLAFYPFRESENSDSARLFQRLWLTRISDTKRFRMILRDDLMQYAEKLAVSETAFAPHAMVFGNMHQSVHGIEVVAEITDDTSEIHEFIDVYSPSDRPYDPEVLSQELCEKLHRRFPLIDGVISRVTPEAAYVSPKTWIPSKAAIRMRWPVISYRRQHSAENQETSDARIIGESSVSQIMTESYGTGVIPGSLPGDGAITR